MEAAEKVDALEACSLKELDKVEDDVEEDTLAAYRRRRIAELKVACVCVWGSALGASWASAPDALSRRSIKQPRAERPSEVWAGSRGSAGPDRPPPPQP